MDFTHELTAMAKAQGASLVGVAPVERFRGAPSGHHPTDLLPGARVVVSFGIRLLERVLEWPELLQGSVPVGKTGNPWRVLAVACASVRSDAKRKTAPDRQLRMRPSLALGGRGHAHPCCLGVLLPL